MNKIVASSSSDAVVSADSRKQVESLGLLYEMIRSFVTLASTLNLSHAVAVLPGPLIAVSTGWLGARCLDRVPAVLAHVFNCIRCF